MNTRILLCSLVMMVQMHAQAQEIHEDQGKIHDMGRIATSLNAAGVIFFGPMINAQIRIVDQLFFNTHVRFPSAGFAYRALTSPATQITGFSGGGGFLYFFGKRGIRPYVGIRRSKPYLGIVIEYGHTVDHYPEYGGDLASQTTKDRVTFALNAGYRFSFESGVFINVGGYAFISKELIGGHFRDDRFLFAVPEVSFGYEFGAR